MAKIKNNAIYLIKNTRTSQEFLALCNFQSYFHNGDYLNLIQFFTKKQTSEGGLKEFLKIDFGLYNDEIDELTTLSSRYSIIECLGVFSHVIEQFHEDKHSFTVSEDKIKVFLENMVYLTAS